MKKLSHILPKPHTWLVGAVILYLLSFLFERSFSPIRSINIEINRLENYIETRQNEFNKLVSDTSLIRKLADKTESLKELNKLVSKSTGIFIFRKSIAGQQLLFWSNQVTYPPDEIFGFTDTSYFRQLSNGNGFYVCTKKTFAVENNK
ncbi:MAG TPA: hypothetical protein VFZ33_07345, partial [Chitinophagaceae bacterium]